VTTIEDAATFWEAEEYHQEFYKKHADVYAEEKQARDAYKETYWGVK
jgi:peptide-methionine (S)-S-oxide reductase